MAHCGGARRAGRLTHLKQREVRLRRMDDVRGAQATRQLSRAWPDLIPVNAESPARSRVDDMKTRTAQGDLMRRPARRSVSTARRRQRGWALWALLGMLALVVLLLLGRFLVTLIFFLD